MAATSKQQEKEPLNEVHQDAIFRETVSKEQRHQKLYTNFTFNPYNDYCVLAEKPNSKTAEIKEDAEFLQIYRRAQDVPPNKYDLPLTEAQEIGWDTQPLVTPTMRGDVRLHHPLHHSEITTYMEAYWRQKEQEENMQ